MQYKGGTVFGPLEVMLADILGEVQTQRLPVTPCDSPKRGLSEPGSEKVQPHRPFTER